MKKKPTFSQLAKVAGVCAATVSRVAAGRKNVDPEIRERVRKAAARLGIDLERKRDEGGKMIAFVMSNRDMLRSFQARVLAGAESYASLHGWEMVFLTFRYPTNVPARQIVLPEILSRRGAARGVILTGINGLNMLHALGSVNVPFTVLGNNVTGDWPTQQHDVVFSNDVQGAFDLTRYLIAQNHRDIWYIGDARFPWFVRRGDGYRKAMLEAGLPVRVSEIHSDGRELGYLGAKSILSRGEPVTAIFAGSDLVAGGVYAALQEAAQSIPRDISVVGFNDSEAATFHPPLTTVREFPEELGRHLVELILNRIKHSNLPPQQLVIPTQLVVRESVRPAAGIETAKAGTQK